MKITSTNVQLIINNDAGLFKIKETRAGTELLRLQDLEEIITLLTEIKNNPELCSPKTLK